MVHFTSKREKTLWLWVMVVLFVIFATLFVGRPLANLLENQDLQAIFFLIGMVFVGATILIHAVRKPRSGIELTLVLGIMAVYIMLFLRLGLAERSHLIEYSVLAILIHMALLERKKVKEGLRFPALFAMLLAFVIGVIDESLQLFIPERVFDPVDILFNGIVIVAAIGAYLLIHWIRNRTNSKKMLDDTSSKS